MVELQTKAVDEVIAVFREMQARMGQLIEGLKDMQQVQKRLMANVVQR